jgi:succinate dehydrogenase/fumarate reductase flavoprotein subunit
VSEAACDLLVVGSGAAGFAAALTANHHGLDVILTEKEPVFGGTTAYSAGVAWIPASRHAARAGVADSREQALTYLQHETGNRLDHARARAFVDTAAEMLEFLEQTTHVRYQLQAGWPDYHPDLPGAGTRGLLPVPYDGRLLGENFAHLRAPLTSMMLFGGMMVGRDDLPHLFRMTRALPSAWHCAKMFARYAVDRVRHARGTRVVNGNALVARLAKSLFERGIPLWLSSPVTALMKDAGKVTGAIVRRNGKDVTVIAKRGVVLACGGFPHDEDLKRRYYPHVAAGRFHQSAAPPSNTGDGIRLGQSAGAAFLDAQAQPAAWTPVSLVPQRDGSPVPFPHFIDRGKPGVIAVDRRGKRFISEARSYHDFTPAMIEACAGDAEVEAYLVTDHRAFRRYGLGAAPPAPAPYKSWLRSSYLVSAPTIAELADKLGVDVAGLVRTVQAFNVHAATGDDPEFHKGADAYERFGGDPAHGPNPCVAPLRDAPFYAVRIFPGDIGTFLGLRTDAQARVLDRDGAPIAGLYAAGNDAASVMGGCYPGPGITIGPAMTFGYIAARHAAGVSR